MSADAQRRALLEHVVTYLKTQQPDVRETLSALISLSVALNEGAGRTEAQLLEDVRNGYKASRAYELVQRKGGGA
jgi:hypothetical protein